MNLVIQTDKLIGEIEKLATFSSSNAPTVTRVLYSSEDQASRVWLKALCKSAGLQLKEDAIGNLFARWVGSQPELPAVATGSHTDAIPYSGKYDGVVGVLGAIEAIRSLQRAGFQPKRSIELIHFTAEEPTRFGIGCMGSRAMAGTLNVSQLQSLKDPKGYSLDELRDQAGFSGPFDTIQLPTNHYHSFVELHIEQGPRLEKAGVDIGIVSAIAAPATLRLVIHGEGGHAGAVLMPSRKDALIPATQIIQEVERVALESGSPDAVATVGLINIYPGAVNSIPSKVELQIDIRDIQLASRNGMINRIKAAANAICTERKVNLQIEILNADHPCLSRKWIMQSIEEACVASNYTYQKLVSRAYHDTLFMANICPTSMIFIPSFKGYSHRPEEYSSPEEIEKGVKVLALTLAKLSRL